MTDAQAHALLRDVRALLLTAATARERLAFERGFAAALPIHGEAFAIAIGLDCLRASSRPEGDLRDCWGPAAVLAGLRARAQVWA